jgi:transposase-like protein
MERESSQESRKYTPEYKLKLVMEMLKCVRSIAAVAKESH